MKTPYTMHNQVLECVSSAGYLGVDFSDNLNCNTHINRITSNANKFLGFIKRNIRRKHPGVHEGALQTIVWPQIEYGSTVWSPYTQSCSSKIEMVQCRPVPLDLNRYFSYKVSQKYIHNLVGDHRTRDGQMLVPHILQNNGLVTVLLPTYFQRTTPWPIPPPRNTSDPHRILFL